MTIFWNILGGIIAGFIAACIYEWLNRPHLHIALGTHDDNGEFRIWHLMAENRRCWFFGNTAFSCEATLHFYDMDGTEKFSMSVKWDDAPEPVAPHQLPGAWQFDPTKVPFGLKIDMPAGSPPKSFAVAIKHRDEVECYGLNGWSYEYNLRHPNQKLEADSYRVKAMVFSGASKASETFLLINESTNLDEFILKDAEKDEGSYARI